MYPIVKFQKGDKFKNKNGNTYQVIKAKGNNYIVCQLKSTTTNIALVNSIRKVDDCYEWDCGVYFGSDLETAMIAFEKK